MGDENAKAERWGALWARTLKEEEVYLNQYDSFTDAEMNIDRFITEVYNAKRLHSSLGYLPPAEFEAAYAASCPRR